ncbi:MFS transporter [Actinoplanes sp. NPDC051851]|uniref:MFS transporter n=1 Tax=Actinoplanes sp. NPDC051851 TaxID=3154753 RepID=UPI00341E89B5
MVVMPLLPTLGRTVGTGIKAIRLVVRGSVRGSAWATRRVGSARARGAANEVGMIRLFDLHAVSCAGDALIAIGLAGTVFSVPLGEARSQVGLYLLITMVPFALLAPVVGPLLDHFRHGRRYALAVTMLGRAFLAYVMADNLLGWGLYPAAFGILALSRAYGVARSAAVPRLLPSGVGLSQVGARASVYGTFAGALVAPIGLLAFKFGPQWPLRVATIIFLVGMVVSLRLPPRADSDPPEAMPRAWRTVLGLGRGSDRPLSGRLVLAALAGSSALRLLYGFLLLFLTFSIMGGGLDTGLLGLQVGRGTAVGVVGAALGLGTFLSTAAGTGLRIRRPLALQSGGLVTTALAAILTAVFFNLATVTLLALLTAIFSGIAKLAVDASIQERVPERLRATAFAHSETVLMLAWVTGGGLGLVPLAGRLGIGGAALLAVMAAAFATWAASRTRGDRLNGRGAEDPDPEDQPLSSSTPAAAHTPSKGDATIGASGGPPRSRGSGRQSPDVDDILFEDPIDPWPAAPTVPGRRIPNTPTQRASGDPIQPGSGNLTQRGSGDPTQRGSGDPTLVAEPTRPEETARRAWWGGRRREKPSTDRDAHPPKPDTRPDTKPGGKRSGKAKPADLPVSGGTRPDSGGTRPDSGGTRPDSTGTRPAAERRTSAAERTPPSGAPPGYHVYRPSSAADPENGEGS